MRYRLNQTTSIGDVTGMGFLTWRGLQSVQGRYHICVDSWTIHDHTWKADTSSGLTSKTQSPREGGAGKHILQPNAPGFPSRQIDMHYKKWLNQTKYGLHGQPAINLCFPHGFPMVSPCFSQKNPADFTSAIGEATVARPSHAGSDLLVREEIAIDRTDVIQLGGSWKMVVWVSMAIH